MLVLILLRRKVHSVYQSLYEHVGSFSIPEKSSVADRCLFSSAIMNCIRRHKILLYPCSYRTNRTVLLILFTKPMYIISNYIIITSDEMELKSSLEARSRWAHPCWTVWVIFQSKFWIHVRRKISTFAEIHIPQCSL